MTGLRDAGGQPVETWQEAARSWLDVADYFRSSFGDEDPNNHELNALRDMADVLRPHVAPLPLPLDAFDAQALIAGRSLCAESGDTNPEYVRGIAELLIDMTEGVSQDEHKDALVAYLGGPL